MIGILVRRGADFAAAEDAVQDALLEALRVWPDDPPRDPKGWLVTVAWRKFLDANRADTSRRRREELVHLSGHSVMVGGAARNGRSSSHSWIGSPPGPGAAESSPASSRARS